MDATRRQVIWPMLCMALAAVAGADLWLGPSGAPIEASPAAERARRVQQAFDTLPMRQGPWVGVEMDDPELPSDLAPARWARASRTYTNIFSGTSAGVTLLWTGAPRGADALGPRRFFASQGWDVSPAPQVPVDLAARQVMAIQHRLVRESGLDREQAMALSFRITPEGIAPADTLNAPTPDARAAVVYIHLLFAHPEHAGDARATAAALLPMLTPLRESLDGADRAGP